MSHTGIQKRIRYWPFRRFVFSTYFYFFADDEVATDILKVFKIDLHIQENGSAHHTEKYDAMIRRIIPQDLIIRRGQEFFVTLFLSREFRKDVDGISFVFSIVGKLP